MKVLSNALRYFALPPLNFSRNLSCVHLTPSTSLKCPVSSHTKKLRAQVPTNLFFFAKDSLTLMWVAHQGCECSSLIVAATRVRIPASCQILYVHKVITRDGERTLLDPGIKRFLKYIYNLFLLHFFQLFLLPQESDLLTPGGIHYGFTWRCFPLLGLELMFFGVYGRWATPSQWRLDSTSSAAAPASSPSSQRCLLIIMTNFIIKTVF